jgi:hypothetical protein
MTKVRKKRGRDRWDDLLDKIDFKGLTQEEVVGQGGFIKQLTGRLLQKALEAEMTGHLGYEKDDTLCFRIVVPFDCEALIVLPGRQEFRVGTGEYIY